MIIRVEKIEGPGRVALLARVSGKCLPHVWEMSRAEFEQIGDWKTAIREDYERELRERENDRSPIAIGHMVGHPLRDRREIQLLVLAAEDVQHQRKSEIVPLFSRAVRDFAKLEKLLAAQSPDLIHRRVQVRQRTGDFLGHLGLRETAIA